MIEVSNFVILGVGVGAVYALIALGAVLVYRGSGVLNFAHGALGAIGAYLYVEAVDAGVPVGVALAAGVLASAAAGAITFLVVMRPVRTASPVTRLVASLGVLTVIQQVLLLRYGSENRFVAPILPRGVWRPVDGLTIPLDRLWILAVAVVLTTVLWVISRYTRFGWATVAVAENERATAALGWSPNMIGLVNWSGGAALAGLAAILILPILGLSVVALTLLIIPALATALVGGFRSFPLVLVGGLGIGIAESLLTRYVSEPGWAQSVPFLVIIVVLTLRGDALPQRGAATFKLPLVGSGRFPWWAVVALAAVGGWMIAAGNADRAGVLASTFAVGLIMLSLIVVTGYAGQPSLAQYALAGMGAFVAGRTADVLGAPFLLAAAIGVVAAIPLGAVVALPALRTRGVSLAIVSFGLALAIENLVLNNIDLTGGFAGTQVEPPTLFGWDVDAVFHPHRYAYVCLAALLVATILVANLRRGIAGRRLLAVRANERAAATLGISTVRAKVYAFALGSALAALGGILLAFRSRQITFGEFTVEASINAVVFTVLTGIGFLASPLMSAASQPGNYFPYLVSGFDWDRYFLLIGGILLIVNVTKFPDGALARPIAMFRRRFPSPPTTVPPAPARSASAESRVPPGRLAVRGISVHFGGVTALTSVDLDVPAASVTGLIGPNGAGKTTLIDTVSGLARADEGTIVLNGTDVSSLSPRRRSQLGLGRSFQSLELFEDLTVYDNIRVACDDRHWSRYLLDLLHPRTDPLPPAALAAIAEFDLGEHLDQRPADLSYGQRRLVAIARAVAAQPSVLLLDEPAAGLDEPQRRELASLIRRLADDWGMAILLVEHDVPLVMDVCDRVIGIDFGKVIATGSPVDVAANQQLVAAYLGADGAHHPTREAGVVDDVDDGVAQIAAERISS